MERSGVKHVVAICTCRTKVIRSVRGQVSQGTDEGRSLSETITEKVKQVFIRL